MSAFDRLDHRHDSPQVRQKLRAVDAADLQAQVQHGDVGQGPFGHNARFLDDGSSGTDRRSPPPLCKGAPIVGRRARVVQNERYAHLLEGSVADSALEVNHVYERRLTEADGRLHGVRQYAIHERYAYLPGRCENAKHAALWYSSSRGSLTSSSGRRSKRYPRRQIKHLGVVQHYSRPVFSSLSPEYADCN